MRPRPLRGRALTGGKRRNSNGAADPTGSLEASGLPNRGFTDHEHIEELGLVHMNGRLYDPLIARFISADPIIADPLSVQAFNRYSYVDNNPLTYTDPTGYLKLGRLFRNPVVALAVGIVSAVALGPAGLGWIAGLKSLEAAIVVGAVAGGLTGGIKGAIIGGISGALTFGIGGLDIGFVGRAALHGVAQGGLAAAQGGDFGSAFLGAAIGSFGSSVLQAAIPGEEVGEILAKTVASAVVGGAASVAAGGKFANGAATSAFIYMFNHLSHEARARLVGAGAFLGGTAGAVAAGSCTAGTGGLCAVGAPTLVAGGIAAGAVTGEAIANAWDQLDNLLSKSTNGGPQAVQYALVAERAGLYPTVHGDLVQMNAGDVWKYGISTNPMGRYPAQSLGVLGLRMDIQATGTLPQVYVAEKIQLINYAVSNGALPPGNKIFK